MTLDEKQRRCYVATRATACGCHGVNKVSDFSGINHKTIYAGIKECLEKGFCDDTSRCYDHDFETFSDA